MGHPDTPKKWSAAGSVGSFGPHACGTNCRQYHLREHVGAKSVEIYFA